MDVARYALLASFVLLAVCPLSFSLDHVLFFVLAFRLRYSGRRGYSLAVNLKLLS